MNSRSKTTPRGQRAIRRRNKLQQQEQSSSRFKRNKKNTPHKGSKPVSQKEVKKEPNKNSQSQMQSSAGKNWKYNSPPVPGAYMRISGQSTDGQEQPLVSTLKISEQSHSEVPASPTINDSTDSQVASRSTYNVPSETISNSANSAALGNESHPNNDATTDEKEETKPKGKKST